MPNGVIHEQYRKQGRVVVFPLAVLVPILLSPLPLKSGGEILVGLGIFIGYEFGRYCNPDWDCATMTTSESWMVKEIPIVGFYLFGVSSMYGAMFMKFHRHWITHFPFISTSIRYLFTFLPVFLEIYRSNIDWAWLIFIFIGAYIGTSLSDAIHWWLDNHYGE